MRSVLFSVSAHSRVWLGHTTHPCCHRRVSGSPAHRTMLPNRPTPLRLLGERGRGRSFSAGDCGPQPHTGGAGTAVRPVFPGGPGRRAGGPRLRKEGGRAEAQGQPSRLRPRRRRRRRASARLRPPRPRRPRALAPPARRLAPVPSSARSRWRREGRPGCRTASCRPRSPWRPAGQHSQAGGGAEGARPGPRAAAAQAEETARGRGRG